MQHQSPDEPNKMGSAAQQEAQRNNWLIYRAKGLVANMWQFKQTMSKEPNVTAESFRALDQACDLFEIAMQEIIKDLRNDKFR